MFKRLSEFFMIITSLCGLMAVVIATGIHRLDKGLLPACVANCPVHVFHFGDLDDPNSEVSRLLGQKRSFRLLEENGTQPRVYYLQGIAPTHDLSLGMPSFAEVRGKEVTI